MGPDGMKTAWLENRRKTALCCAHRHAPEAAIPSLARKFAKKSRKSGTR
jgi:hypothetical protein